MRVYVGEQDEVTGNCRVWIVQEEPRPEVSEIVDVLGDLNQLMDLRRDGTTTEEYEQHRASAVARKNEIIEQIRKADEAPRPVALRHRGVHSPDGFAWGYAGSGPADLAYSILLTEIGEEPTPPVYLQFRDEVVALLPDRSFRLGADVVWEWIEANRSLVEAELFEKIPAPGGAGGPAMAITDGDVPDGAATKACASAVVRACEQAWREIQRNHPDLPDAVIILGSGVERGRLVKLGHWWGARWIADGQARGEVLLAGEALHLPAAQVFEVLLHEAAHGLNAARRIPDTSRGGRYHNQRFADTAREVLLEADSMPPYGFAATKLTPAAEKRFEATIDRLDDAIRIARQIGSGVKVGVEAEGQLGGGREGGTAERDTKRNDAITALCECSRRLRMAPSVYQQGPVVCGVCGSAFRDGAEQRKQPDPEPGTAVVDRSFLERRRAALEGEIASRRTEGEPASVLDAQRARLHAALKAAADTAAPALRPLQDRLDRIDRLLGSLDHPDLAVADPTTVQREGVRELALVELTPEDAAQLARWYENFGTPDEHPMPRSGDASLQTHAARSLLKADGTLREPRVAFGDEELLVGDRVLANSDVPAIGLGAGMPGTIEAVDDRSRSIEVDFAIWGRLELSETQMREAGIAYDYVAPEVAPMSPVDLSDTIAIEASRIDPGFGW